MTTPLSLYLKMGAGVLAAILLAALVANRGLWMHRAHVAQGQYAAEHAAFVQTTANYRAAADEAKRLDAANADRVRAEQSTINQESSDDYEKRLAAARATAASLRAKLAAAAAHPGSAARAAVPGISAPASGPAQAAGQDGLSDALTCTEQAIQLDELIKWMRKQAGVDVNGPAPKTQGTQP